MMNKSPEYVKSTFKDKIRERFSSVKQKSSDSIIKAKSSKTKRKTSLHNQLIQSHLGEFFPEEQHDADIDDAVATTKADLKLKAISEKIREKIKLQNDFFFLEEPSKSEKLPTSEEDEITNDERKSPQKSEKKSHKTALDYFDIEMNAYDNHVSKTSITYNTFNKNADFLFWDGTLKSLDFTGKRDPVEEGHYVGVKPVLHNKRYNHLKALFSHSDNASDWFGPDGELLKAEEYNIHSKDDLIYKKEEKQEEFSVYRKPVFFNAISRTSKSVDDSSTSILELDFGVLKFDHHPLFSLEHILAKKLINSYEEYILYKKEKSNNNLNDLLSSLRHKKVALMQSSLEFRGNNENKVFKDKLYRKCVQEISEVRQSRNKEMLFEKEIEKRILILWQNIKAVRKKLHDINTSVVLEINRYKIDIVEDRKRWEDTFEKELCDMIDEVKCDYFELKADYHEKNKKFKEKSEDDDMEKPSKPILNLDEDEIRKELHYEMCKSFRQPGEPCISFNLNSSPTIITVIPKDINEINRRVDVDKTKFYIKIFLNNREVCRTKNVQLSHDFKMNINERYSVKLMEDAYSLKLILFEQNSLLPATQLSEIFVSIPKEDVLIIKNAEECNNVFKINSRRTYTHNGVGALSSLSDVINIKYPQVTISYNGIDDELQGKGVIGMKIGWSNNSKNNVKGISQAIREININNQMNLNQERHNIKTLSSLFESNLDPNNPENAYILRILSDYKANDFITDKFYFDGNLLLQFNEDKDETKYISKYHRNDGENITNVDADAGSTSSFGIYENRIRESVLDKLSVLNNVLDPIDLQRRSCMRYLQLINQHLFLQSKTYNTDRQLEDLVTVLKYPGIRSITMDFLRPKRPLFHQTKHVSAKSHNFTKEYTLKICILKAFQLPNRRESVQTATADNEEGLKMVNLRPFVRISCQGKSQRTSTAAGNNPTWNEQLCLPIRCDMSSKISINLFDEIFEDLLTDDRLEGTIVHCQYSANWIASLKISLANIFAQSKIEGTFLMYSPPELLGYKQNFEEKYSNSHVSYDSLRKDILLKQREGFFISMYLELYPTCSEIILFRHENFESSEMEFMIKYLNLFCENYKNQFPNRKLHLLVLDTNGKNICITRFFQPLPVPDFTECLRVLFTSTSHQIEESLSSKSSTPMRKKTSKSHSDRDDPASKSLKSAFSTATGEIKRHSRALKETFEMKSLESNPVDDLESGLINKIHICTRFISLIPLFEFHSVENRSVVLSGPQFLKLACGSMMDHTILLMNYFLYLGVDCWLVAGIGLPRGTSSYVLIRENLLNNKIGLRDDSNRPGLSLKNKIIWKYSIYDATTGMKYDSKDSFCPLQKVYYACNDENIWVNIQPVERCDLIKFNFNKTSDWRPVFQKARLVSCPGPLPGMLFSASSEEQLYNYSTQEAQRLRDVLEDKIKIKFQKWRGHRRTVWNRHCSSILRRMLTHWEKWCINPSTSKPKANHQLQQMLISYQIYGFPFNTHYITISDILSSIKATQLHLHENSSIEFALGMEIFAYPNNIFSVWIYPVSIVRK